MLGVQLHLSKGDSLDKKITPVKNGGEENGWSLVKPNGGLWTSTWDEEKYTSGWVEWCREEYRAPLKDKQWFLLIPAPDARVFTIDSHRHLKGLLKKYRRQCTGTWSDLSVLPYLDFEKISQDYDALHLTDKGQGATRLEVENLYGWDCESTIWFHWCFQEVRKIEVPLGESARK